MTPVHSLSVTVIIKVIAEPIHTDMALPGVQIASTTDGSTLMSKAGRTFSIQQAELCNEVLPVLPNIWD